MFRISIIKFVLIAIISLSSLASIAGVRFASKYPCRDSGKTCVSSGTRTVSGFSVYKSCWQYSYNKTCDYPSKNDCRLYDHCYSDGDLGCLLKDSLGNCINMKKSFNCKSWEVVNKENKVGRMDYKEVAGKDGILCKNIPCIGGHCVDKSYETNGNMMDSLSKLHAASHMKAGQDGAFSLFQGSTMGCSKKMAGALNCCRTSKHGWIEGLGAKCTKDEMTLMEKRNKNVCVHVGRVQKKVAGVVTLTKHRFCCFGDILDKVVQVEGRKQLGIGFGSGPNPDCRGLTLEEIQKIDWSKIDFSEFINELKVKFSSSYKTPTSEGLKGTIKGSLDGIQGFDSDLSNAGSLDSESFDSDNLSNLGGVNTSMKSDPRDSIEESKEGRD